MLITIKIIDDNINLAIKKIIERLSDLTPAMRAVAGVMLDASMRAFGNEQDPQTGLAWQKLSPAYQKQRAKEGSLGKILERSGQLKSSLSLRATNNSAIVGTNKSYAGAHQFGASINKKAGTLNLHFTKRNNQTRFATAKKAGYGMKASVGAHTINIPARPFLGLGNDDIDEIKNLLLKKIVG